jgi:hypothetical protein
MVCARWFCRNDRGGPASEGPTIVANDRSSAMRRHWWRRLSLSQADPCWHDASTKPASATGSSSEKAGRSEPRAGGKPEPTTLIWLEDEAALPHNEAGRLGKTPHGPTERYCRDDADDRLSAPDMPDAAPVPAPREGTRRTRRAPLQ